MAEVGAVVAGFNRAGEGGLASGGVCLAARTQGKKNRVCRSSDAFAVGTSDWTAPLQAGTYGGHDARRDDARRDDARTVVKSDAVGSDTTGNPNVPLETKASRVGDLEHFLDRFYLFQFHNNI